MDKLNQQALNSARVVIANRFGELADLDDIGAFREQLIKQLASAESKLNVAVQGKLDALKRAVDLMDESAGKLNQFSNNMQFINERIANTCSGISNFKNLKIVHNARENLKKVISQVEFFARVPEKVKELHQLLDSEPYHLKEVFLEAIHIEALRVALVSEIKAPPTTGSLPSTGTQGTIQTRRKSIEDERAGARKGSVSMDRYSVNEFFHIKRVVEQHLSVVPGLLKDIRLRLWDNIERIWSLSAESPADMVMTFEIIEMYQEYITRRSEQERRKALKDGKDGDAAFNMMYENLVAEASDRLKVKFEEKVESTFLLTQNAAMEGKKVSKVSVTLSAATQMLTLMASFSNEVVVCIPTRYEPMKLFLDSLDSYLLPEILRLIDTTKAGVGISSLDVGDLIQLIDWLEYYVGQMDIVHQSSRESCGKFKDIAQELLHEYLARIKGQVMEWFDNIKKQETEIVRSTDGTLFTSTPEDMFNVLHMQMTVAAEKLPREHLKDAVTACLSVLRDVQRTSYDTMKDGWTSMSPEGLCAYINDMQRMQEKCDEFTTSVLKHIPQHDHKELLSDMGEAVCNEYITLAVDGVSYLVKCVMQDLSTPLSTALTLAWEADIENHSVSSTVAITLEDYVGDIFYWIPEFFFTKFIKEIYNQLTAVYVMSLRKSATETFQFRSEVNCARGMIVDMEQFGQVIRDFFGKKYGMDLNHDIDFDDTSLEKSAAANIQVVLTELAPISSLARIVSASHASGVEFEMKNLYAKYNGDGIKLVFAAIQANPSMNYREKADSMEFAMKSFQTGVKKGLFNSTLSDTFKNIDSIPFDLNNPAQRINVTAGGGNAVNEGSSTKKTLWERVRGSDGRQY